MRRQGREWCLPEIPLTRPAVAIGLAIVLGSSPEPAHGDEPAVVTESVQVHSSSIYPSWRQLVVRDSAGNAPGRPMSADAFRVTLRDRDGVESPATPGMGGVRLSTKPVSLSIIVDRSTSMRGSTNASVAIVRECLLRLGDHDRIRLATFATDQRRTAGYFTVGEYKTAAVVQHVRATLRRNRPPTWLSARDAGIIEAMSIDERSSLSVQRIAAMTEGLTAEDWIALQRTALDDVLRGEFRNGGATLGSGVLEGAMRDLIDPGADDFIPALDSNAGVLIITDDPRALPMDDLATALLRVLVVQACVATPPAAAAVQFPSFGMNVPLREQDAEGVAAQFIARLRDVYELELDLPHVQYTRPGGVKVDAVESARWRVIMPSEALPTRETILVALEGESSERHGRLRRRDHLLSELAAGSPSAQIVLAALRRYALRD